MKNPLLNPTANTSLRRLLGGWRDVLDDIRSLCRNLEQLPGLCECGHAPAHLQGNCRCCGTTTTVRVPNCEDCEKELASLRPAMDSLAVDTFRVFAIVKEVMSHENAADGQRAGDIERCIAALLRSFEQLVVADGQFRTDCRASHLHTLKDSAAALRRDAEALNRLVSPQSEGSYVKD